MEALYDLAGATAALWPLYLAVVALATGLYKLIRFFVGSIGKILHELQPNGGGSMKDHVDRMVKIVDENQSTLGDVVRVQEAQGETLAHMGSRVITLVRSSDDAWYEMDENANVVEVNAAYRHLFDVTDDEALNTVKWRDRIPPTDLVRVDAEGARLVENPMLQWNVDFRVAHKGLLVPVHGVAEPTFDGNVHKGWKGTMTPNWSAAVEYDTSDPWPPPPTQPWTIGPSARDAWGVR